MNGQTSSIVKVDLGDGRIVAVEARNVNPEKPVAGLALLRFDGVTDSIVGIAEKVTGALERVRPDQASVEFGVDMAVESGALTGLIAKGSGSATLKVTLEWHRKPGKSAPDGLSRSGFEVNASGE